MQTHMVEMRDGIRLATDIHMPPGAAPGERFPVIVERTPYGRNDISGSEVSLNRTEPLTRGELAARMVQRGYVVVMQDVRGRGGSEGVFTKYVNEADDGADSFDWILSQPWCDGRICTMGLSYGAHTQLAAAVGGARGIAAMAIDTGGLMDLWRYSLRFGGGFELKQVTWSFRHAAKALRTAAKDTEAAVIEATDIRDAILNADWRSGHSPLAAAPDYEAFLLKIWAMKPDDPSLHGPATCAAAHFDRFPDVPVLLLGSWFDPYASNMMALAAAIRAQNNKPLRQIMGPWLHGRRSTGRVGDADFGPAATIDAVTGRDWVTLRLDWFDYALRRGPAPLEHDLFFEMAPLDTPDWPNMGGHWRNEFPKGDPVPAMGLPADPIRLSFDPAAPFPTLGGGVTSGGLLMQGGMFDHRARMEDLSRAGKIFSTGPLARPLTIAGIQEIGLQVHQIIPPGPADISATLMLANRDGSIVNLSEGFLRLKPEAGLHRIELLATYAYVPAGAELLLLLSTANFPRIDFARHRPYAVELSLASSLNSRPGR